MSRDGNSLNSHLAGHQTVLAVGLRQLNSHATAATTSSTSGTTTNVAGSAELEAPYGRPAPGTRDPSRHQHETGPGETCAWMTWRAVARP
jgi:hypothetical protein